MEIGTHTALNLPLFYSLGLIGVGLSTVIATVWRLSNTFTKKSETELLEKNIHSRIDKVTLETRQRDDELHERMDRFDHKIDKYGDQVGQVAKDVSYIRGRIEPVSGS